MKKYSSPSAEFIVLSNNHVVMTSGPCGDYNCPNMYGSTCTGHCYSDTSVDPDCPDDSY